MMAMALLARASVVQTELGLVEAAVAGDEGPVVVVFHGAPGGVDQGALLTPLVEAGFRVVSWSRPGYRDTPINSGPTFSEQGDLAAALLDSLGFEKAAAIGVSAGGPAALSFATRHPTRTWALVLEAAVVDAYVPSDLAKNKVLGRMMLSKWLGGLVFPAVRRSMLRNPEKSAVRLLEIESTLDEAARAECGRQIAQDPESWRVLAESLTPWRARRQGLRNDLEQLEVGDAHAWVDLSVPTLLQYSPSDADVPMHHAQALIDLGVPAELVVHDDACGHLLWFGSAGRAVADRRRAFLIDHAKPRDPGR